MSSVTQWAVIIVTYNSAKVLPRLLDSLSAAVVGAPGVRVVVVDNDSADDSASISRAHPIVDEVVQSLDNRGFAAGINAGFDHLAPTDGYLVLNADTRPAPETLQRLIRVSSKPNVGIVVPRLLDGLGGTLRSLRREPSIPRALGEAVLGGRRARRFPALSEIVDDPADYEKPLQPQWATGAAWLVTSRCHISLQGWDERFFLYSEETDFAARARDLGFVMQYEPSVRVEHEGGEMSRSPYLWAIQVVNRIRYYRSRHGRFAAALFRWMVVLNEALRITQPTHRAGLVAAVTNRRPDEVGAVKKNAHRSRTPGHLHRRPVART